MNNGIRKVKQKFPFPLNLVISIYKFIFIFQKKLKHIFVEFCSER